MTQTTARIKQGDKNFEIMVDLEKALDFKKGKASVADFLELDEVFTDSKKGLKPSDDDLKKAFGTTSINEIAEKIVQNGEVLLTQEHRDEKKEQKIKQVVDFLSRNAIDPQSDKPHTPERIKSSLEQANINLKNTGIDNQITDILEALRPILPLKISTKKIKITIPAIHTGKAYGVVNQYKEKEEWLENGDLKIIVKVPSGIIMDFYDKLNSITHGSAVTEEIKE